MWARREEARVGVVTVWKQKSLKNVDISGMITSFFISIVDLVIKQSGSEKKTRNRGIKEQSIFKRSFFANSVLILRMVKKTKSKTKHKKHSKWGHPFSKLPMTRIGLHLTHLYSKILLIWVAIHLNNHLNHSQLEAGFKVSHPCFKISQNPLLIKVVF